MIPCLLLKKMISCQRYQNAISVKHVKKKKKKTNPLTNEKHVLVVVIFTHVSSSLIFDTNDVISFIYYLRGFSCLDQIFFFLFQNTSSA